MVAHPKFTKRMYSTPLWYLIGIFLINIISFIIYFFMLKSQDVYLLGLLNITDLIVIFGWFVINIIMIFYFVKHHAHKINLIFPIYFLVLYIYIFVQIYLMWFQNIYLAKIINDVLTVLTTLFELGFAGFIIYKKYNVPAKFKNAKKRREIKTKPVISKNQTLLDKKS